MAGRFTIEAVFKAIDQMSKPLTKMRRTADKFAAGLARPLRRLDRQMGRVHQTTKRVAGGMVALGAGAAAVGVSIARSGMDFEQSITNVGAVMLKTRGEIGALERKALSLGATTKFTASEVAQGMEILAKGGFSSQEILAGIGGVMSATAASAGELAEVSGHVTGVLKGMGLAASDAGRVADVLTLASSRTNSTISSLGESMQNVASKAHGLGIPLEETVAALALLQDQGIMASVAGSALNSMLSKLADPSEEVSREMRRMGVTFQDAKGDMLPLAEVLSNISKGLRGAGGNMKQAAFLVDLVGMRGEKAASQLARLGEKQVWQWVDGVYVATNQVEALTGELRKAHEEGTAKVMADLRMGTLAGDLLLLESAIDGVKTALFDGEGGGQVADVVRGMTAWITANRAVILSGASEYIRQIRDNWAEIVSTLKTVGKSVVVFYATWMGVKAVTAAISVFRGALVVAEGAIWAYGKASVFAGKVATMLRLHVLASAAAMGVQRAAMAVASRAMLVFNAVARGVRLGVTAMNIAILANPVGLVVAGVVAAVGALGVAIYAFWPQIKPVFSWIADKFAAISDWFSETLPGVVGVVRSIVGQLKALFAPVVEMFGGIFSSVGSLLGKGAGLGDGLGALMSGDSGDAPVPALGQGTAPPALQMVPPHQPERRLSAQRSEHTEEVRAEVVIRDETGRAEVSRRPQGGRFALKIQPSGAF